ncbi:UNVERIFIED_ORG: hypothetical protein GGI66_003909 [Rhizobium esperanzae]
MRRVKTRDVSPGAVSSGETPTPLAIILGLEQRIHATVAGGYGVDAPLKAKHGEGWAVK